MEASTMGEFKFNCPSCAQKIQCTADWAGHQIQCPVCRQNIQVPAPPAPPPEQAKPAGKPSLGLAYHQKTAPPPVSTFSHGNNPARHYSPSQAPNGEAKRAMLKKIAIIAACVILLPRAGYFAFIAIRDYQAKLNIEREREAANSDGGQVGHIASLYDALDATDPSKYSRFGDSSSKSRRNTGSPGANTNAAAGTAEEKLVPPAWTLDVEK